MLKIFSLLTNCKQFSIGSIKILPRFSIGRYNTIRFFIYMQVSIRWI